MSFEFLTYPDREALALDLADQLASDLREALSHEDRALLVVPGGTSPGPVFDALCGADLDWGRVDVLLSDERWVPPDHERSNTRLIRERLITDRAAAARILPLWAEGQEADSAAGTLAATIADELPIAVLLLGMGADRHTASLFPGADNLDAGLSADAPILLPMRAPGAPEPRLTVTAPYLNGAMRKHILIYGDDKRAALDSAKGMSTQDAPINAVISNAKVHWAE